MSAVLRIENLSKVYRLGELNRAVFFDDFKRRLGGDFSEVDESDPRLFWALRDVTFEVQQGEVVGLLGRNGAGKSTLLKVLAQITAPTRGWVGLRGRVASLLEVGTGFHLEMTGRENVFLNGTFLGMNRREVQRKFDEIVAFSGVEEFLDSPVKHYSVGMRVRLAFAVAAHLEPEILLVDEVLAVGDASFQKKCLGKIGEVSRSGRTVLLVSHNSAAIEALCTRGVLLEKGRLMYDGSAVGAIEADAASRASLTKELADRSDRKGSGEVRVTAIHLRGIGGAELVTARCGQPLEVALDFERNSGSDFPRLAAQITISTHLGAPIFTHASWLTGTIFGGLPRNGEVVCAIPRLPLAAGHYHIAFKIFAELRGGVLLDHLDSAADLTVEASDFFGSGTLPGSADGSTLVDGTWRLEPVT
jgi:lipopolysaccharide transport system ATP-binding protein